MRHTLPFLLLLGAFAAPPPPLQLTAKEDLQRQMDELKIKELRRGADGRNADAPNAANYDEAKANPIVEVLLADHGGDVPGRRGAGPVYNLLGKKDMGTGEFPPIETPLMDGDVSLRQHPGGHTPGPNGPVFLTFAERYFKR